MFDQDPTVLGMKFRLFDSVLVIYTALDEYVKAGHELPTLTTRACACCGQPLESMPQGSLIMQYLKNVSSLSGMLVQALVIYTDEMMLWVF